MARTIPVGFAEGSIVHTGGGGTAPYVVTIGVSVLGIDPEDYVLAANNLKLAYEAQFAGLLNPELAINRAVLQIGLAGGTSGSVESDTPPTPGTGSGSYEPVSMAVIARKNTNDLGRKGRGRSFLPGLLTDPAVDAGGRIVPSSAEGYGERWNEFLTALATLPVGIAMAPVLLHNDGSTPTPITGGTIAPQVGWIRKRIR